LSLALDRELSFWDERKADRMRILHVDTGREMRGGQWQAMRLIQGLAECGQEARLLCPAASPLFERAAASGIDVRPFGPRELRTPGIDLVHAHDARSHTWAAILSRRPVVVSRRVAFAPRTGPLSRWKYARARHYVAVSNFVARRLMQAGVPEWKISVIYDGVPLGPVFAGGDLVVAPATADPLKGPAMICEAARLAGVQVCFSHELETDLARARLFLYASFSEGLGSAVLLAMAAGVPVIASREGGLTEIIDEEQNGILVQNTPESFAAAITRILSDGGLGARLAQAARTTVADRFSIERMVRATMSVYQQVLS
jgi:L-malate glycosyltransferase